MRQSGQWDVCRTIVEDDPNFPWQQTYRFDFSYIRSDRLRREFQDYLWSCYRSRAKTLTTLRQENSWFKYYEAWLHERGIDSLSQIRPADAEGFLTFLHTCLSKKTDRPLRLITQKHIYDTVRGIYRYYAMRRPEYAMAARLFPTDVYRRINRITRIENVEMREVAAYLQVLEGEENPCLRYGGKILSMTGLSQGELLGLRTDCIQSCEAGYFLHYYSHRKRKWQRIPVNETCAKAVQALEKQTEELRKSAPPQKRQQLFLHRNKHGQTIVPSPDLFRYWMRRTALFDDMRERNVPCMVIRELGGNPFVAERRDAI